jgi:hypothetical protein
MERTLDGPRVAWATLKAPIRSSPAKGNYGDTPEFTFFGLSHRVAADVENSALEGASP